MPSLDALRDAQRDAAALLRERRKALKAEQRRIRRLRRRLGSRMLGSAGGGGRGLGRGVVGAPSIL